MRTIIHDLEDNDFFELESANILDGNDCHNCVGCFKCWTHGKTCVIKDKYYNNGEKILDSDELIIISKCNNGCYSSKVKKMLERSISLLEPYFTFRNHEIHHKTKTDKKLNFKVYFYGENITDKEKIIAKKLVKRNILNINKNKNEIYFYNYYKEINIL